MNIQTDSIVETDIHQHRLYTRHHRVQSRPTTDEHLSPHASAEVAESKYPEGIPPSLSDIPPESTVMSSASATTSGSTGWETILLPFNAFVRTNYGFVMEPQTSLLRQRVKSIGIGLTDRVEFVPLPVSSVLLHVFFPPLLVSIFSQPPTEVFDNRESCC